MSYDSVTSVYLCHESDVDVKVTFSIQIGGPKVHTDTHLFQSCAQKYGLAHVLYTVAMC